MGQLAGCMPYVQPSSSIVSFLTKANAGRTLLAVLQFLVELGVVVVTVSFSIAVMLCVIVSVFVFPSMTVTVVTIGAVVVVVPFAAGVTVITSVNVTVSGLPDMVRTVVLVLVTTFSILVIE